MDYLKKLKAAEQSFVDLFSSSFAVGDPSLGILRYHDEELKDMYDHNFSFSPKELNEETFALLTSIKASRGEGFMKVSLPMNSSFLKEKGFEEECLYTLIKESYGHFDIPKPRFGEYRRFRDDEAILDEVIEVEKLYYGKSYGESFCTRKWIRYGKKIKEGDNGLDIWGVYFNKRLVAYCYTYFAYSLVCIDCLLVIEEERNKYVASNLIKDIGAYYSCPIYLHADEDDTPKELYAKLGFEKALISFDYLKVDE
ncbi:MAG: hypothetical protein K6B65_01750 [Bacilli bacterium]|nr:hypothetical protein [Bacilli bacterium]